VSPAYRLLPEANGSEILNDITDFWSWVRTSLPARIAEIRPHLTLDVHCTAATGESAGGYLALQSAFLQPAGTIKAVMAQYCTIYPDIALWNPRPADGGPAEAHAIIEKYLSGSPLGTVRLSSPFPATIELASPVKQTGCHRDWMGGDGRLTLEYGLRTAAELPPIWIMQGIDDQRVSFDFRRLLHRDAKASILLSRLTFCAL